MSTIRFDYDYEAIDNLAKEMDEELFDQQAQQSLFDLPSAKYYVWNKSPEHTSTTWQQGEDFPVTSLPEKYQERLLQHGFCPVIKRKITREGLLVSGIYGILALASPIK